MPKWEYLVISYGNTQFSGYKPQYLNGQEMKNWKKISLHQLINQLGDDGWEMSGSFSQAGGGSDLFFKRPKP